MKKSIMFVTDGCLTIRWRQSDSQVELLDRDEKSLCSLSQEQLDAVLSVIRDQSHTEYESK